MNKLYASGKKKSYLKNLTSILVESLKYAVVPSGLIQYNPAAGLIYPKLEYDRHEINRTVITAEQFETILKKFPAGNPYHYALLVGYYTGLRIGETYGLTWDDIDLKNGTISVNKSMYKHEGRWAFGSTKIISSNRTIPIGKTLIAELSAYKRIQKENELRYGEFYTECYINESTDPATGRTVKYIQEIQKCAGTLLTEKSPLVFRKEDGALSTVDSFKYCARVIHYDLGIQKFNYHSLRHTHATMLIEAGVNVKAVQERLGHANIQTTMNSYVHNTEHMASNAVEVFEKIAHG